MPEIKLEDELKSLNEKAKSKKGLTPTEKGRLKFLTKRLKADKEPTDKPVNSMCVNAFAKKESTTKVQAYSVRFLKRELTGLQNLADNLVKSKGTGLEKVIRELGSTKEINKTKLIRAAIYLLHQKSEDEIIEAIKEVRMSMYKEITHK